MSSHPVSLEDYARRRAATRSLRRLIRERFHDTARAEAEAVARDAENKNDSGAAPARVREAA